MESVRTFAENNYTNTHKEINLLVDVLLIGLLPYPQFSNHRELASIKPRNIDFVEITEIIKKLGYDVTYEGVVFHHKTKILRRKLRKKLIISEVLKIER